MPRFTHVSILIGSAFTVPACDPAPVSLGEDPLAFSVADVNQDGRADLVAISRGEPPDGMPGLEPEQILVRFGRGDGSFDPVRRSAGPYAPERAFFMDANGDALLDLLVAGHFGNAQVFNGDGRGGFTPGVNLVNGCERSPGGATGELNGDAFQDVALLCSDEGFSYMTTHFGTAGGTFTFGSSYTLLPANRGLSADVAIGDLNGDGSPDLMIAGFVDGQQSAIAHLNDGAGNFTILPPIAAGGRAMALADLDGDGKLDAVTGGAALVVLRGLGDGSFAAGKTLFTPAGESIEDLAVADVNGDAKPDVVAITPTRLHSFPSPCDGREHREHPTGPRARDLVLIDLNGDGQIDAVNLNFGSSLSIHFNMMLR